MKKVKVDLPELEKISMSAYHPKVRRLQVLMSIFAAVSVAWAFYEMGAAGITMPFVESREQN